MSKIKEMQSQTFSRELVIDSNNRSAIDEEKRTVEIAFSSEEEVERWFGYEILDHGASSVRVERLKNGGALLVDHDHRDQVGVIERLWIDSDRVGRAVVRFGRSERATEVFNDVIDGIRSLVSVGYRILGTVLTEQRDGVDIYRVTDWEPYEISFVSVPADVSVGVGRSEEQIDTQQEENKMADENKPAKVDDANRSVAAVSAPAVKVETIDVQAERAQAQKDERERMRDISAIGVEFDVRELADEHINNGHSVDDMRQAVLTEIGKRGGRKPGDVVPSVGMASEDLQSYSVARAVAAVAYPNDRKIQTMAGFELEASREAAKKAGFDAQGIMIPGDVLKRDLQVAAPSTGSNIVDNTLMVSSMIDLLRNKLIFSQLNPTYMADLQGDVTIPGQSATANAYWIDEGEEVTESDQAIRQIALTPKTIGAFTEYTRKLLLQSSIDVENFIIRDLITVLALGIDHAAMYGSGASSQPRGIANQAGIGTATFAAAGQPTFEELVGMETEVASANADVGSMAYLMAPGVRGHAKTTEKFAGTGMTIWEQGNTMNGYGTAVTNQMAVGDVMFGQYADLVIGMWGGLDLMIDPYTKATSGGTRIVAMQSVDTNIRNAASFVLGNAS